MSSAVPDSTEAPTTIAPAAPLKRRPSRWKRLIRWIVGSLLLLLLIVVAAVIFRNPLLRKLTEINVREETGLRAEIGAFEVGFTDASMTIRNFKLYNNQEFGGSTFMDIPLIHVRLSPEKSTGNRLAFEAIHFDLATINVVRNEQGELNVDKIKKERKKRSRKRKRKKDDIDFGGVQTLTLNLGTINFIDLARPENNRRIDLGVHNKVGTGLDTEEKATAWLIAVFLRSALEQYYKNPSASRNDLGDLLRDLVR